MWLIKLAVVFCHVLMADESDAYVAKGEAAWVRMPCCGRHNQQVTCSALWSMGDRSDTYG